MSLPNAKKFDEYAKVILEHLGKSFPKEGSLDYFELSGIKVPDFGDDIFAGDKQMQFEAADPENSFFRATAFWLAKSGYFSLGSSNSLYNCVLTEKGITALARIGRGESLID
ncbi:hypothetical protein [Paraburkholderia caribensis]|uniref:hypothetical protein n=1 Tax=Paraburkholderia caribensis TaxID=75105 RepID=UPI001CAFA390|nr:hypothetical protein [Paraburkholderia caribensis]CAG9255824.1 hypothetical protein PCAR4_40143 [Paraburkholderia caribensis]